MPTTAPLRERIDRYAKAAITFHITIGLPGGATMHIRRVEVFTVTDDGLISAVTPSGVTRT